MLGGRPRLSITPVRINGKDLTMLGFMVGRMRRGASVLGAAALMASLALPSAAAQQPPALPPDGVPVVTLGDSYASGEGAPAAGTQPWTIDVFGDSNADGCHRSILGGHAIFGQAVAAASGTQYVNAACSGATTISLGTGSKGEPSQLAALGPGTGLVTLSIGGNDAAFSTVAAACNTVVPVPGLPSCAAALAASAGALQALTTAGPGGVSPLQLLHSTVQAQAPNARVLITGYPLLFPTGAPSAACSAIAPEAQQVINQATVQLNAAIAASAQQVGATYVDLSGPFSGHSSCENDPASSWIRTITPSDPVASFHPNVAGQVAIAAALARAIVPVFADVVEGQDFYADIRWLAESGLSTGTAAGDDVYFYPASAMSRQAMAAFMYRYSGAVFTPAPNQQTFDDVGPDNPFYVAIEWMAAQGLATGYDGDLFGPARPVSRQAVGAFLHRLAGEPLAGGAVTFPDVPAGSEFADAITWLEATGVAEGYEDGTFGPALPISRQAMAAILHRFDALEAPSD